MKSVTVFCGASAGNQPHFVEAARDLGRRLANANLHVVYGGGHVGLMGVLADAALQAGGHVVGVIPHDLERRELAHPGAQEMYVVNSMHERKALMGKRGDAFAILPGGFGTLEEYFEVLTWLQLGFHTKPCCLINTHGYFDHLLAFLDHSTDMGFVRPSHRALVQVAPDPQTALALLMAKPPTP